jgi:hypothetical protein
VIAPQKLVDGEIDQDDLFRRWVNSAFEKRLILAKANQFSSIEFAHLRHYQV